VGSSDDARDPHPSRLTRVLGLPGAVVIGVGAMLGTGVFAVWSPALDFAGSGLLIALALAATIAALNATSTARLAAALPYSGGAYAYGRLVVHRSVGIIAGYAFVLGKSASAAAAAFTIGFYLSPSNARLIALTAIGVVLLLDLRGIIRSVRVTGVLLVIVITTLAILIASWWLGLTREQPAALSIDLPESSAWGVVAGAGLLFVAFAGYARITVLGEEVKHPHRTIPRAVALSFGIVLVIYLGVATMVMSARTDIGDLGAAALETIADSSGGSALVAVVRLAAILAAGAVLLSLLGGVGRTLFAMGSAGDAPRHLARVSTQTSVPYIGSVTAAALAAIVVMLGGLGSALAVSGASILLYYSVAHLAAWIHWRTWHVRIIAALGFLGCLVVAVTLVVVSVVMR
jgi:basic amino acid/polyamine antiporter, APA family